MSTAGNRMLTLIKKETSSAKDLKTALADFAVLLDASEEQLFHLAAAKELVAEIAGSFGDEGEPPWQALISSCSPQPLDYPADISDPKEGLCILHESAEPWRSLKHLFVLI